MTRCFNEEEAMNLRAVCAAGAALCLILSLTGTAEAQKKGKKSKGKSSDVIMLEGCAHYAFPTCVGLTAEKTLYIVSSANPPIAVGQSLTLKAKKTSRASPCGGVWLEEIKWKPNKKACGAR
jgi:hypothetical protein